MTVSVDESVEMRNIRLEEEDEKRNCRLEEGVVDMWFWNELVEQGRREKYGIRTTDED